MRKDQGSNETENTTEVDNTNRKGSSKRCLYKMAREIVRKVLGSEKTPEKCKNVTIRKALYEKKKVTWNLWTGPIKKALVEKLFRVCRPKTKHAHALRIILEEEFPELFGFGQLFNTREKKNKNKTRKNKAYINENRLVFESQSKYPVLH